MLKFRDGKQFFSSEKLLINSSSSTWSTAHRDHWSKYALPVQAGKHQKELGSAHTASFNKGKSHCFAGSCVDSFLCLVSRQLRESLYEWPGDWSIGTLYQLMMNVEGPSPRQVILGGWKSRMSKHRNMPRSSIPPWSWYQFCLQFPALSS